MNYKLYGDGEMLYVSDWNDREYRLISPTIKMEVNKAGSTEFTILPQHPFYDSLPQMKTRIEVRRDEDVIFRGRVLSDDTDTYKQRKVYCEGALAYLVDSILGPSKGSRTAKEHFELIVNSHNVQVEDDKKFVIGDITIDEKDETHVFGEDNYRESFSAMQSDLLDAFGGYFRIRFGESENYIDYLKEYDSAATQTIEFGQNLIELGNKRSGEDLFTVLLPVGKDKLTIESAGASSKYTHNGKYLENTAAIEAYGRIVKMEDFGDIDNANTLMQKAEKYMADNYKEIPPELSITAVDLHLLYPTIKPFNLGDTILVKSTVHSVERKLMCTAIELNIQNPEKTRYTLTDPNQITVRKDRTLSGASSSTSVNAKTAKRSGSAAESLLEKFITEKNGVLTIKDRVLHLESLPGGRLDQITAALDVGDGTIIGNVKNSLDTLSTTITQTETSIRAEVDDKVAGVRGSLELTIKDVEGVKQSVLDIDTDITNINSEITNIKNLYASKAYVDELVTQSAIIKLLDGGYVKTAALSTNSADIGYLEVNTMTFGGSTVSTGQVKVVTDFTQASTYGIHLEGDTEIGLCKVSDIASTTYTPSYGDKIAFS